MGSPRKSNPSDGNVLQYVRSVELGLTQAEAARRMGVSRALFSFWERKERAITVANLNRMQASLDLTDRQVAQIRKWVGDGEVTESVTPQRTKGAEQRAA